MTEIGDVTSTPKPGPSAAGAGYLVAPPVVMSATAAETSIVLVSAVALIDADERILLTQRPVGKPMAGLWEFPGGKVDPGETPESVLIRDLAEELGVEVTSGCLAPLTFVSHSYIDPHLPAAALRSSRLPKVLTLLYVCRKWSRISPAIEGSRGAWVRPSRLGDYPMSAANRRLVKTLSCDRVAVFR